MKDRVKKEPFSLQVRPFEATSFPAQEIDFCLNAAIEIFLTINLFILLCGSTISLSIAACGGGGGGSPAEPINQAPQVQAPAGKSRQNRWGRAPAAAISSAGLPLQPDLD